jgi:hypothetical protein
MKGFYDPIMAEMRRTQESRLDEYGSWENYSKHLDEQRPVLEAQGWHFVTPEEHAGRLARRCAER